MKKLILLIAVASLCGIGACGQANKNVPEAAKTFMTQKFPNATDVKWGKEGSKEWEVEFKVNGKNFSATFDNKGAWKESEYEIAQSEIPAAVNATIQKEFAGFKITLSEISETKDGKVYEFGLAKDKVKKEVAIDASGKVVSKEKAEKEED